MTDYAAVANALHEVFQPVRPGRAVITRGA
jgi:hypothetical protein